MRMTPGFTSNDIKPDIVLISNEDDIRLYVNLTLQPNLTYPNNRKKTDYLNDSSTIFGVISSLFNV